MIGNIFSQQTKQIKRKVYCFTQNKKKKDFFLKCLCSNRIYNPFFFLILLTRGKLLKKQKRSFCWFGCWCCCWEKKSHYCWCSNELVHSTPAKTKSTLSIARTTLANWARVVVNFMVAKKSLAAPWQTTKQTILLDYAMCCYCNVEMEYMFWKKKKNNKIQRIIVSYWCGFDYTHCRLDRVGYCQDNIIIRNSRWTKLIIIIIIKIIINNNKKKSILFFIIIELIRAMQKEFLIIVIIVCAFFLLLHPAITTIK